MRGLLVMKPCVSGRATPLTDDGTRDSRIGRMGRHVNTGKGFCAVGNIQKWHVKLVGSVAYLGRLLDLAQRNEHQNRAVHYGIFHDINKTYELPSTVKYKSRRHYSASQCQRSPYQHREETGDLEGGAPLES